MDISDLSLGIAYSPEQKRTLLFLREMNLEKYFNNVIKIFSKKFTIIDVDEKKDGYVHCMEKDKNIKILILKSIFLSQFTF